MEHGYLDEYSHLRSFLHSLEPRIKVIVFFAFILFVALRPSVSLPAFIAYGSLLIILIFTSNIPMALILKRSLGVIPFIALMSAFIPFVKSGRPLWESHLGAFKLSVSDEGLRIFAGILAKAYLSAACMLLLILSTNFLHLLKALEKLKVPAVFIMIVSFMYRYVFILQDEFMHMKRAKESRTVGGSRWFHVKALANMAGVLFVKSYERAEDVYLAMLSRGFDGKIKTVYDFKIIAKDIYFLLAAVSLFALIGVF